MARWRCPCRGRRRVLVERGISNQRPAGTGRDADGAGSWSAPLQATRPPSPPRSRAAKKGWAARRSSNRRRCAGAHLCVVARLHGHGDARRRPRRSGRRTRARHPPSENSPAPSGSPSGPAHPDRVPVVHRPRRAGAPPGSHAPTSSAIFEPAPVGADDDPSPNLHRACIVGDLDSRHPIIRHDQPLQGRPLDDVDGRLGIVPRGRGSRRASDVGPRGRTRRLPDLVEGQPCGCGSTHPASH